MRSTSQNGADDETYGKAELPAGDESTVNPVAVTRLVGVDRATKNDADTLVEAGYTSVGYLEAASLDELRMIDRLPMRDRSLSQSTGRVGELDGGDPIEIPEFLCQLLAFGSLVELD